VSEREDRNEAATGSGEKKNYDQGLRKIQKKMQEIQRRANTLKRIDASTVQYFGTQIIPNA
jgi:hypothetical protein